MSWLQLLYGLIGASVAISAVDNMNRASGKPVSVWVIFLCAALWPCAIILGVARLHYLRRKGETSVPEEASTRVPDSTRRH